MYEYESMAEIIADLVFAISPLLMAAGVALVYIIF